MKISEEDIRSLDIPGSELDDAQEEIGSEMKKITTTASGDNLIWRKTMDR
jgi:hypothetical protein